MLYTKKNFITKSTETATWKLATDPFVFARNQPQPLLENRDFEAATCIRYSIAKRLKFIKNSTETSLQSFLQKVLLKVKKVWK